MESYSIFDNKIFNEIYYEINKKKYLFDILGTIDNLEEKNIATYCDEKIWNFEAGGQNFSDWLYGTNDPTLKELKQELSIKILKSKKLDSGEYDLFTQRLQEENAEYHDFELQFHFLREDNNDIHFVKNTNNLNNLMRWYMEVCPSKEKFMENLEKVFPDLIFSENIQSSLSTLNTGFSELIPEIVEHLSALSDFCNTNEFKESSSHSERCKKIKEIYKINCSPESKRETAEKLKIKILIEEVEETINCEYHTKFNLDGRERGKQDRIYFGFFKDKIIIRSIGDHI